jgi:hypothetical protein
MRGHATKEGKPSGKTGGKSIADLTISVVNARDFLKTKSWIKEASSAWRCSTRSLAGCNFLFSLGSII